MLRACSSSTALTVVGLHTHVRTHRTSNDPAYLLTQGLFVHGEKKRGMYLFPGSRPKKGLSSNGFTKTVTVRLRSIVPKRPGAGPTTHGLLRCKYTRMEVCVECLFLRSPGRVPYRTSSACAKMAAYPDPPPVVLLPGSIAAQAAYQLR